ncbi:metalloregulator ArsR/SmtB family transcription factor [Caulobacter sp. SLTY]|uniref:ArsR/SmtB family transcription factor n=1 Tax=Caulobacter sp. SLTY TaxID=2683262 RepID=UPI0014133533|nr:metalloregulator ArsR/SmtB family transcription factor [Caulobacter sp. SLTY]NBB17094.1 metalloregulator ArsR/SmtB family transcription factor [Caulobacter sp. SLTY]
MSQGSVQTVEMLRAAGEPTRLRILSLLAAEELSVLELCRILDQSQPRVSRHLKLLAEAGLVQRFPDGAWVFYRLSGAETARRLVDVLLDLTDDGDPVLRRDGDRLAAVQAERTNEATAYFARNAEQWDKIRTLYASESQVEAAIERAAGQGALGQLVDLGAGTGRMLTLLGTRAERAIGLDLSQQMLNIARVNVSEAGLAGCELRHGDIFATGLPGGCADLVTVHQVLHYLSDPAAAVAEAARLVAPGGRLLIIDFAPHGLEFLRSQHQHRRLGLSDDEVLLWLDAAGLEGEVSETLPTADGQGLTIKIWAGSRPANTNRSAA